ncbi:MAG TPA: DUF6709 family protein [Candidatus Angelobacter sp.]
MPSWVENEAMRANRNLLKVNGLILAGVLLVGGLEHRYLYNFFTGCARIDAYELASLTSPSQRTRNFVTVTGARAVRTGYRDVEQRVEKSTGRVISSTVKDEYILLRTGGKLLLVKALPGAEKLDYSGELVATKESVRRDLLGQLSAQDPALAAMVLPFTLNAADYRNQGIASLIIGVPLLLLTGWNFLKGLRRNNDAQSSPTWRGVAAYGPAEQVSARIEQEQPGAVNYGRLQIMNSWLVSRSYFKTRVCALDDLVWAYKKVTKHSVNFIPTGKTYSVILCTRRKEQFMEQMKEAQVDAFLQALLQRAPWSAVGFNQTLAGMWRRNKAEFIAMVDTRRQKATSASAG